jgi:predicted alpha/beta hydrolase family esterase
MTELELEVQDGDIIITLPGSSYTVTYYKPMNSPQLLARRIASRDDPRVAMRHAEFLAAAWRLANNKARKLGWIV